MTRTVVAVAAVAASVVLAGCGGEEEEPRNQPRPGGVAAGKAPARSGEASTKREFLRKVDALCAAAKRRAAPISAAIKAKIASEDAAGVAAAVRKGLPIADELLRKMRALPPPKDDEVIVGKYLDIIAAQRRHIPPLVEALEAEDISNIEVLAEELRQGNQRAERLAGRYGFTKCTPPALLAR